MSDVLRFDSVLMSDVYESKNGEYVQYTDYAKLEAEAQALREEVERSNRITVAMALDISAVGEALGIPGEEQGGGTGEFIDLIRELQKEVEALRARVVVVPNRLPRSSDIAAIHQHSIGWNACLDELARLNGLTVREGLLRRVCAEQPATCCMDDEMSWRRDRDSALIELRALLNEDKENGNG
ncbi:TPA: hypothetical protein ACVGNE_000683 [Pseudomonas aeruginosa]|uniref:hypothetical protein n=1 Tax=Pseudomonas aeruginosa TaxID=287 RepID=UPI000EAB4C46|nr:hypothetical protein [Pseudomonas aeruginosa]